MLDTYVDWLYQTCRVIYTADLSMLTSNIPGTGFSIAIFIMIIGYKCPKSICKYFWNLVEVCDVSYNANLSSILLVQIHSQVFRNFGNDTLDIGHIKQCLFCLFCRRGRSDVSRFSAFTNISTSKGEHETGGERTVPENAEEIDHSSVRQDGQEEKEEGHLYRWRLSHVY